ncbi:MAG: protocatechuate 4,5-dioxygenase subunit alpha [Gammaproteobacteria bacterium]|nr:MAG: protocatechuate 4,5-dioxygenase subunit alpha [Gammaproteobacteria bacterium]TDJ40701.1 MAG: protocatechuate 4,5-dioxygenase subunit alpha [Gammaproteobacteria bacterium]
MKDYSDIPGTYVFDGEHSRKGYRLNMFCMSLNEEANRELFIQDESAYLDGRGLTPAQKRAVLDRDYLELLKLGGNIYYTFKIAMLDRKSMQYVGGQMSGMTEEAFKEMMANGGRAIEGNRRVGES